MIHTVKLEWFELSMAVHVGGLRRLESRRNKFINKAPSGMEWETDIEGCCAEIAVAKFLNRYWSFSVNTIKDHDLNGIGVRMTQRLDGCLIIRPEDTDPNEAMILVCGSKGEYKLIGGIFVGDAKKLTNYIKSPNDRPPAFFIPPHELFDVQTLNVPNQ